VGYNYGVNCPFSQFILDISNLVVITSSSESRTNGRALGGGRRGEEERRLPTIYLPFQMSRDPLPGTTTGSVSSFPNTTTTSKNSL